MRGSALAHRPRGDQAEADQDADATGPLRHGLFLLHGRREVAELEHFLVAREIELAREGGVAFIPKLSGQRTIALSSLNEAQRQRVVSILEQAFPRGQPPGQASSPGSGDQRYFRIQIIWTGQNQAHYADIIVLVPEQEAPESLVELWKKGEGCVCD